MPDSSTQGIGDMRANFAKLGPGPMQARTGRRMVVAGGKILKAEAKVLITSQGLVLSGAMLKEVAIKIEKQVPPGVVQINLGERHGRDLSKKKKANFKLAVNGAGRIVTKVADDPWYFRFPELGTKKQPKTSFLAQALVNKKDQAIDAMVAPLNDDLVKASTA